MNAEILIVDEALSVGDLAFQKKCIDWIDNFRRTGTLLFVSHSTAELSRLCNHAIWIDNGHVREAGDVANVARAYRKATLVEQDSMSQIFGRLSRHRLTGSAWSDTRYQGARLVDLLAADLIPAAHLRIALHPVLPAFGQQFPQYDRTPSQGVERHQDR